eukprot:scaffold1086_cov397-Prasinococcus_capsulatus_cf.AAC.1
MAFKGLVEAGKVDPSSAPSLGEGARRHLHARLFSPPVARPVWPTDTGRPEHKMPGARCTLYSCVPTATRRTGAAHRRECPRAPEPVHVGSAAPTRRHAAPPSPARRWTGRKGVLPPVVKSRCLPLAETGGGGRRALPSGKGPAPRGRGGGHPRVRVVPNLWSCVACPGAAARSARLIAADPSRRRGPIDPSGQPAIHPCV